MSKCATESDASVGPYAFINGIRERTGLDLRTAGDPEMRALLRSRGAEHEALAALSGGRLQDEVFKVVLEPDMVQPTFVIDYPKLGSRLVAN